MIRTPRSRHPSVQTPLESYLREINETPLLKAEEEKELANRIEGRRQRSARPPGRANLRWSSTLPAATRVKAWPCKTLSPRATWVCSVPWKVRPLHEHTFQHLCQLLDQAVDEARRWSTRPKPCGCRLNMVQLLTEWRRAGARLQEELGRAATEEEIACA